MPWTEYYRHVNGTDDLYALPLQSGVWSSSGAVSGVDTNQNTLYIFSQLSDGIEYEIFVQSSGSPIEGDSVLARLKSNNANVASRGVI